MSHRAHIRKRQGRNFCSRHHAALLLGRSAPVVNDLVRKGLLRLHRLDGKRLVAIDELMALKARLYCHKCGQRVPEGDL